MIHLLGLLGNFVCISFTTIALGLVQPLSFLCVVNYMYAYVSWSSSMVILFVRYGDVLSPNFCVNT